MEFHKDGTKLVYIHIQVFINSSTLKPFKSPARQDPESLAKPGSSLSF